MTVIPITSAKDKAQRRLEVKARNTLMMGITNEHQLKFYSIKDDKLLLEAIEKRFEDVNQKLLRSLSPEWNTRALMWRNEADLDTMSMDDLYNNLKVYEPEVKGISSSSSSTQNMAFVSSSNNNTSRTNEAVNAAHRVTTVALNFDKSNVECYNCHKRGNFARECRAPRNQDNKKEVSRRSVPIETSTSTALVSCDGVIGYDWSDQAEEGLNYVLMAYSSLSFDLEVSNDSNCSKYCMETIKLLKSQNDQQLRDLEKSGLMVLGYKTSLESVEEKLEFYKKNESVYVEKINGLKWDIQVGEITIIPPPYIGNFMPPTPDLSFTGLDEIVIKPVVENRKSDEEVSEIVRKNNDALIIEEWGNPQMDLQDKGVIDSGCSRRMTGNMSYLTDYEEIDGEYVDFGGNPKGGKITGKCTIKIGNIDFENVYFVRELKFNLFSVSQMCDKKNSVLFNDTECIVLSLNFKLIDESHVLLRVPRKNNRYSVDLKNIVPKRGLTCLFVNATSDESKLWHRRLGHLNFKTMNKLVKGNMCCLSKGKAAQSLLFTCVFFLATKDKTSGILKSFITGIENLVDRKVKVIRSRTPQQNGVSERRNRTLVKAARTILANSKLPTTFWTEAINTACYVQNRVLVVKPHNKTPYELFHGRTPTLFFMRPFGCLVTILNTIDHLRKFDGKADEGFFVGYSLNSKAFRVFNSRTRIVEENLHIRFSESTPNVAGSGPDYLFDIDVLTRIMNYEPISSHDVGSKPSSDDGKKVDAEPRKDSKSNDQEKEDNVNSTNNVNAASTNEVNVVGGKTSIELQGDPNMPALEDYNIFDFTRNDKDDGVEDDMNNLDTTLQVSPNLTTRINKDHPLDQVIGDLQSAKQTRNMSNNLKEHGFIEAMQEELLQFKIQEVWTFVDLPNRKRATSTKWVFRNKKNERGIMIRNKARLVAQGYTQVEGIDYDEVFAPIARIEEIRLFLAYASFKDFMVYQMDVKSDFLYGKIKEEVYVCQLPGFEDSNFPDRVYKVEKVLYGLPQAPRAWYETLSTYLLDNEFQRGKIDKTLFIKRFTEVKTTSTPMETQKPLLKDEDGKEVDVHMYRSMIGLLMYLTSSRPDIMYLKGQPKLGLWYPKDSPFDLVAYTDSDYVRASLDRKSTIGDCQFLGSKLILRQYKKQAVVKYVNGEVELQALVDGKKIIIIESTVRRDLQLEDAEGVDCLPNATIFEQLTLMGCKTTAWNEFSSTMASAIICLATNQKFNFSNYIFESMVKNFDNMGKILMYPRFIQVILDKQLEGMSNHNRIYVTSSQTKKIFGNMRRVRKDNVADEAVNEEMDDSLERASTTVTSLDANQDRGNINKTQSKATPNEAGSQGTTSGGGPRRQETIGDTIAQTRFENESKTSNDPLLARGNTLRSGQDSLKLKELMELCTNLQQRVLDLETTKTTQANEIASLKRRVKKIERRNKSRTHGLKRIYRVGSLRRVESSEDEGLGKEDTSKQGRRINTIDVDEDITLVNDQDDADMFGVNDLDGDEVIVDNVDVVKTTEETVIATTTTTTTTATITDVKGTLAQAPAELKSAKPKAVKIVIQEPEQEHVVEQVNPMKRLEQIRLDKELAFKLQAEKEEEERLAREKSQQTEEANIA
ncbi:putative ribonuclease H-like domain-containing protein [Tanacetum coccineum]